MEGLEICLDYSKPLKTVKVNIGTTKVPKFAFIGDYWDEGYCRRAGRNEDTLEA